MPKSKHPMRTVAMKYLAENYGRGGTIDNAHEYLKWYLRQFPEQFPDGTLPPGRGTVGNWKKLVGAEQGEQTFDPTKGVQWSRWQLVESAAEHAYLSRLDVINRLVFGKPLTEVQASWGVQLREEIQDLDPIASWYFVVTYERLLTMRAGLDQRIRTDWLDTMLAFKPWTNEGRDAYRVLLDNDVTEQLLFPKFGGEAEIPPFITHYAGGVMSPDSERRLKDWSAHYQIPVKTSKDWTLVFERLVEWSPFKKMVSPAPIA
jgi:hypothetical protein